MQIQFIRNIQFTKLLKVHGRLREFNFRKLGGINEGFYSVDVVDDRGNRIMFRMQKEENNWRIFDQPVPTWVTENESILHDSIEGFN